MESLIKKARYPYLGCQIIRLYTAQLIRILLKEPGDPFIDSGIFYSNKITIRIIQAHGFWN